MDGLKGHFIRYSFYKLDQNWRGLPQSDRLRSKEEFVEVVSGLSEHIIINTYSLVGTRGDTDLMLWLISPSLELLDQFSARINQTEMGRHMLIPYSYLGMTRNSPYLGGKGHRGHVSGGESIRTTGRDYLFVYPFVKTHSWYQLEHGERQRIMDQHFQIGHEFPSVKITTSYSFGLDDQEFMLGFETNDPGDFVDLVMALRESEARPYTLRDTPIFTCISKPLKECLDGVG